MNHLRYYFHHLSLRRQAFTWLHANPPQETIAAYTLFRLNRHARASRLDQLSIYLLKNQAVRLFCQKMPHTVRTQVQNRYCYACDGSGEYWTGEECYRCGGTGIYSQTRLYLFTFDVHGRRYNWHQPASLVDWDIQLSTDAIGRYETCSAHLGDDDMILETEHRRLLMWVLVEYLRMNKQILPYMFPGLLRSLRADWDERLYQLRFAWQGWRERIPF